MTIANALMGEIAVGKHPIGATLPTERELCDTHGISRHTARESLRQLEQRGLISRRQGSGSTVLSRLPSVRYEQSIQSIDDLLQHGNRSRLEIIEAHEIDADANRFTREIALVTARPCLRLQAIRYARNDARPLAVVTVFVASRSKAQTRRLLDPASAARELVKTVDVAAIGRIEQALTAVTLDGEDAAILQVDAGTAAMRTLRHYFDPAGQLLVIARSFYRGDLYTYLSTLSRA